MKSPLIKSLATLLAANLIAASLPSSVFADGAVATADAVSLPLTVQARVTTLEFQQIVSGQLAQLEGLSHAERLIRLGGLAGTPSMEMHRLFPQEASARTLLLLLISDKTSQSYGQWIVQRRLRRKLGKDNFSTLQAMNREFLMEAAKDPELKNLASRLQKGFPRRFPLVENQEAYPFEAIERDLNKYFDNSIVDKVGDQEPQPVFATSRLIFTWPEALRLRKPTQEPLVGEPVPHSIERAVENIPGDLPRTAEIQSKLSLAEKFHAALSIAYSIGLVGFAAHRLVTKPLRFEHYRQVAMAINRHLRPGWTFWELFNLGGFNDFLTPSVILIYFYLILVVSQICRLIMEPLSGPSNKEELTLPETALSLILAGFGIGLTSLILKIIVDHRLDLMDFFSYGIGGIFAALTSYLLWWPQPQKTKTTRN